MILNGAPAVARTWFITGASRGFGALIAEQAWRELAVSTDFDRK
jgi:NAD(P)-dependent dehydrogenase (short-subunit alcohol dehydrogenase family)